jgi:hypothetical protein
MALAPSAPVRMAHGHHRMDYECLRSAKQALPPQAQRNRLTRKEVVPCPRVIRVKPSRTAKTPPAGIAGPRWLGDA